LSIIPATNINFPATNFRKFGTANCPINAICRYNILATFGQFFHDIIDIDLGYFSITDGAVMTITIAAIIARAATFVFVLDTTIRARILIV
jgi:hypothetical protein